MIICARWIPARMLPKMALAGVVVRMMSAGTRITTVKILVFMCQSPFL